MIYDTDVYKIVEEMHQRIDSANDLDELKKQLKEIVTTILNSIPTKYDQGQD